MHSSSVIESYSSETQLYNIGGGHAMQENFIHHIGTCSSLGLFLQ